MGVVLGLQGDQRFRTKPDRFIQQRDIEIRDADMAREPLPLCLGQRADRLVECNLRVGPVHEQEIDEIDAQVLKALVDRTREVIGAQIFVRHLGGQENLVAPHAGRADALADAALGAVFPGGVDMAIAELQRGGDDLAAIAERGRAESDRRYLGAVRGQCGDGVWGHRQDREAAGRKCGGAHCTIRTPRVNRPRAGKCCSARARAMRGGVRRRLRSKRCANRYCAARVGASAPTQARQICST